MAHALGRTGRDHVAGIERGEVRAKGDDLRNGIDQEIGAGMLNDLVIEAGREHELGRIWDLISRDDPWPEWAGAGEIFARGHRKFVRIAHAAVDEAGIAGDVLETMFRFNVASPRPITTASSPSKSKLSDT